MSKFFTSSIKDIQKVTSDCVSVQFDIPQNLQDSFSFKQGQYITLRTTINGEDVRRSYSLCSSPNEGIWKVAIKQIPSGVFSTYANNDLKKGDAIKLMKPAGNFYVEVNPNKSRNHIAFAAGSGITPMLSIIKTHLKEEPNSTFKLFYLNKTIKSIIFREELEQLKNKYFDRFQIFYFLDGEKRDVEFLSGFFNKEKLQILTNKIIDVATIDHCFICGPQPLIFLIRDHFQEVGMSQEKIHYELFFSNNDNVTKPQNITTIEEKIEGVDVTIVDGGKEFKYTMTKAYDNILDSALAAGADLPYACKGGVCSTCKCKVLDGSVKMKVNYALNKEEIREKFVLSCQAIPTSEKVIVDFDV